MDTVAGGAPVVQPVEAAPENNWALRVRGWLACITNQAAWPWLAGIFAVHVSGGITASFVSKCPWGCVNLITHVALGVVGGGVFLLVFALLTFVGYSVYHTYIRTKESRWMDDKDAAMDVGLASLWMDDKDAAMDVGFASFVVAIISSIFLAEPITSIFFHTAARCVTERVFGAMTLFILGMAFFVGCMVVLVRESSWGRSRFQHF